MGLYEVLGRNPVEVASAAVQDQSERERRRLAREMMDLYQDNREHILMTEIERSFKSSEVKERLAPFVRMACSHSLVKRVVDEIAKHTYNPAPTRFFKKTEDSEAYNGLAEEMRLNAKMDLAVRIARASNHAFLFPRISDRFGAVLDVMDASQVTVIPDPGDPCRPLALIYDTAVGDETWYVYLDDTITFTFSLTDKGLAEVKIPVRDHGAGMLPVVCIKLRETWGGFWDSTSGRDLRNAQVAVDLLTALTLKLHKSQGERQIVVQGDTMGMATEQVLDGESVFVAQDGTSVTTLDLVTNATHYTDTINGIILSISAAYGISKNRLNAEGVNDPAGDVALLERRAETIRVFTEAEHKLVKIMRVLSQKHPEFKLSSEPDFAIDFHEMEVRMSLKDQVEIWDLLEKHALHSPVDSIRALNPEITSDDEAWAEFERNLEHRGRKIRLLRELNAPEDAANDPGKSPQDNGAMGPRVHGQVDRQESQEDRDGVERMAEAA